MTEQNGTNPREKADPSEIVQPEEFLRRAAKRKKRLSKYAVTLETKREREIVQAALEYYLSLIRLQEKESYVDEVRDLLDDIELDDV